MVVVVVAVVLVVVVEGHASVTMSPASVLTAGRTQLSSTNASGEPPSGHAPAVAIATVNLASARVMHPGSTACRLLAAAGWKPSLPPPGSQRSPMLYSVDAELFLQSPPQG